LRLAAVIGYWLLAIGHRITIGNREWGTEDRAKEANFAF
jgi:hypothetical protein